MVTATNENLRAKDRIKAISNPFGRTPVSAEETARDLTEVVEHIDHRQEHLGGLAKELVHWNALLGHANGNFPDVNAKLAHTHLEEMRSWKNQAWVHIHDLTAHRRGMGKGSQPYAERLVPQAEEILEQLRREVLEVNLLIATLELAIMRWHAAIHAASEAISLMEGDGADRYVDPPEIEDQYFRRHRLSPFVEAHLRLALATYMLEGNSPRLREGLENALTVEPHSKELVLGLARFAIMVGDYTKARHALKEVDRTSIDVQSLTSIVEPPHSDSPWLSYPSNFYTYRNTWLDSATLRVIQDQLVAAADISERDTDSAPQDDPGHKALTCHLLWNQGCDAMARGDHPYALENYEACQRAILDYFVTRFPDISSKAMSNDDVRASLTDVARSLISYQPQRRWVWTNFRRRYGALAQDELYHLDWVRTFSRVGYSGTCKDQRDTAGSTFDWPGKIEDVDAFLMTLAMVFNPLAIAEALRIEKSYDRALQVCRHILRRHSQLKILSEFVEKPFVKILMAQILLEKADREYKSEIMANSPARLADDSLIYQGLKAADTYAGVLRLFEDQGQYVDFARDGIAALEESLSTFLDRNLPPPMHTGAEDPPLFPLPPEEQTQWRKFIGAIPIQTVSASLDLDEARSPEIGRLDSFVHFGSAENHRTLKETNPLIYMLVLKALSQRMKLEAGFDFFGQPKNAAHQGRFGDYLDQAHSSAGRISHIHNLLAAADLEMNQRGLLDRGIAVERVCLVDQSSRINRRHQVLGGLIHSLAFHVVVLRNQDNQDFRAPVGRKLGSKDMNSELLPKAADLTQTLLRRGQNDARRHIEIAKAKFLLAVTDRTVAFLRREYSLHFFHYQRSHLLNGELIQRIKNHFIDVMKGYLDLAVQDARAAERAYNFEYARALTAIRLETDWTASDGSWRPDHLHEDLGEIQLDRLRAEDQLQQAQVIISLVDDFPSAYQSLVRSGSASFTITPDLLEHKLPGASGLRVRSVDVAIESKEDENPIGLKLCHLGISYVRMSDLYSRTPEERPALHFTIPAVENISDLKDAFYGLGLGATWWLSALPSRRTIDLGKISDVLLTFTVASRPIIPRVQSVQLEAPVEVEKKEVRKATRPPEKKPSKSRKRLIYHITFSRAEKKWQILEEGADRPISLHKTKKEAIEQAREITLANQPSQLKIHTQDGKIGEERTYGEDPRKIPG